ncbi:MAG TPA: adenosylcobinamide-phosphate synthase CbiB [Burkholderiaceae bacterium]|jgi:adenosylcobinamide-phosphate synthase
MQALFSQPLALMAALLPLAMLVALLLDLAFGEPPTWAHPVVAMGRYLSLWSAWLLRVAPSLALIGGALAWALGAVLCVALAIAVEEGLITGLKPWQSLPQLLCTALLCGLFLKPMFAWRMLRDEAAAVEAALAESLDAARFRLSRLVSRDTSALDASAIREAAIETLAENLNDSVVAPLFWFMIAGLPGAALYRFANTADAMWGYRGRWEWAGKVAARADDLLSWLPARLTGAALLGWQPKQWRQLRQEAALTPSPNSGWPMAAVALRLGARLGKPGVYRLNAEGAAPDATALIRAQDLARQALWRVVPLLMLGAFLLRWHR